MPITWLRAIAQIKESLFVIHQIYRAKIKLSIEFLEDFGVAPSI